VANAAILDIDMYIERTDFAACNLQRAQRRGRAMGGKTRRRKHDGAFGYY